MKPEKFGDAGSELNENEQAIFDALQKEGKTNLLGLKEKGISLKSWGEL